MVATSVSHSDLSWWLRAGWVARGVSYGVAGLLGLSLATSFIDLSGETSQTGALALIADLPLGRVLLIAMAVGLLLFATWEGVTVTQAERHDVIDRIDHLGKLIGIGFYGSLAWSALSAVAGASAESGSLIERLSRFVLSYPLGRVVMVGAGVVLFAISLRRLSSVWTLNFDGSLVKRAMSERHEQAVNRLGQLGEAGRALSLVIVGAFLALAGIQDQGNEARGLDRALRSLSTTGGGRVAIGVVGVGFVAYGVFCALSSPARRLPDDRSD